MRILVTGATGFIGSMLCVRLSDVAHEVVACSRSRVELPGIFYVSSPELGPQADWGVALDGADTVVHLAARAHVLSERSGHEVDALYSRVIVEGTARLARQATEAGVKHFIFVSSIGAMAESSENILTVETPCAPSTPYGKSKLKAELALKQIAVAGGMAWSIIRPPLVYGSGNPGNMERLLKLVKTGLPLPLASVRNRRSFIYVENLVDLIATCLGNPKAFGKTFLPSDGDDLSTAELIEKIARANESVQCPVSSDSVPSKATRHTVGRRGELFALGPSAVPLRSGSPHSSHVTRHTSLPPRLFPFPESILKALGRLPGLCALQKLTSSLYVDGEPIRRELGWTPPFTMEEGLRRTLAKRH
jgi:nucleoside-diphosphate-sugar epimerase